VLPSAMIQRFVEQFAYVVWDAAIAVERLGEGPATSQRRPQSARDPPETGDAAHLATMRYAYIPSA